ncbi:MAG: T9SS type A sorting domain-containing protein, partial [Bacteroidales bacterium]|nr:T9SS type A sorting domain-containing protein [Bacteroidales bacterium]
MINLHFSFLHPAKPEKNKLKELILITIIQAGFLLCGLQAQETIPASGGDAAGNTGSISYTIGQALYTSHNGTQGTVAQGVQLPYEILTITGTEDFPGIELMVSAYPNPVTDYLTLKIDGDLYDSWFISLLDMNGRLLERKNITASETNIVMNNFAPATYILKVHTNGKNYQITDPGENNAFQLPTPTEDE